MTLTETEAYFLSRTQELAAMCNDGSAWVFVCASALIEYLAKIVKGVPTTQSDYKNFVDNYMARVRPEYHSFTYDGGQQDLPVQMYHVLRCGIVHSFSLIPDPLAVSKGGRSRSIVLSHHKNGDQHFDKFKSANAPDAIIFVAEDFVDDIRCTIELIFKEAKADVSLEANILTWVNNYPPIMANI